MQRTAQKLSALLRVQPLRQQYSSAHSVLASVSEDRRLGFLDGSGKVVHIIRKAHPSPISRCAFLGEQLLASGDDDGLVKVWDLRTSAAVFQAEDQTEAITGIAFDAAVADSQLYASCLSGTVAAYDLRRSAESVGMSESLSEELAGVVMVKGGECLACPSSEGAVVVFRRQ
jgi:WD40 repeat protein